jgi:hypothetical protein
MVEPGQRWRLTRDHGNPPLHLRAGMVGTVRELVDAETPGAHNDHEDSAVLVFPSHDVTYEAGEPTIVTGERAVAFALADFDGDLFEQVPA